MFYCFARWQQTKLDGAGNRSKWRSSSVSRRCGPSQFYGPPLFILFPNPRFLTFFNTIAPNEIQDKQKDKLMKESYFMFRKLQNRITCFFCMKKICEQHENWDLLRNDSNLWNQKKLKRKTRAIARAFLRPVHWFEHPNNMPQKFHESEKYRTVVMHKIYFGAFDTF